MRRHKEEAIAAYIHDLRQLPFIRGVEITPEPQSATGEARPDAILRIKTPRRTFRFGLELKRTFLDQALTNAVIGQHAALQRTQGIPLLLAARYIPRPTGERLAAAGVNFIDRPGNVHLTLGDDHHVLVLGRREASTEPTARRVGPALVQLAFVLLADPEAAAWPLRKLAAAAGIGKTAAATARERLTRLGLLGQTREGALRLADQKGLADEFVTGYGRVLRPHLHLGRFRAQENVEAAFLKKVAKAAKEQQTDWALTGGPAAYALDRFYRGAEIPIMMRPFTPDLQRALRLVPDRQGAVVALATFGERWHWRTAGDLNIAHPWLVYAELVNAGQARALEAAAQFRDAHLKT
jgi:hypothetical protein